MIPSRKIPSRILFEAIGMMHGRRDRYFISEINIIRNLIYIHFGNSNYVTRHQVEMMINTEIREKRFSRKMIRCKMHQMTGFFQTEYRRLANEYHRNNKTKLT